MKLKAFGVEQELVDHLRSLIEANTVTLESGGRQITELGIVLNAALGVIQVNESFLKAYEQESANKTFIVTGRVSRSEYMVDDSKIMPCTRIVHAKDEQEAEQKFTKYWEDQTQEYSVYYCVLDVEAAEAL